MPETVAYREDLGIIEVTSSGDITMNDIQRTVAEISRLAEAHGTNRVLIDAVAQEKLPSVGKLFFLKDIIPAGLRLASTKSAAEQDHIDFVETVTSNRGIAFRFFDTREDALAWLREG